MKYTATLDARRIGSTGDYSHIVIVFDEPGPFESQTQAAIYAAEDNGFEVRCVKSVTPIVPDIYRKEYV